MMSVLGNVNWVFINIQGNQLNMIYTFPKKLSRRDKQLQFVISKIVIRLFKNYYSRDRRRRKPIRLQYKPEQFDLPRAIQNMLNEPRHI